jgi:hypothetical protein
MRVCVAISWSLRFTRAQTKALSIKVLRSSLRCKRTGSRTFRWFFVRSAPAMARPCKTIRGLSLRPRYNRFLDAASELPASELARALAANGHDTLTLLVTSKLAARETVVGEARVALSCAERAGEFGMSSADDWHHLKAEAAGERQSDHRLVGPQHIAEEEPL